METIKDIVEELREHSGEMFPPWVIFDEDGGLDVTLFADRIEQAAKALEDDRDNWRKQALAEDERANATQPVTNCNGFKMRSALEAVYECAKDGVLTIRESAFEKVLSALATPPRNCDLYETEPEAYQAYLTAMKNKTKKTYVYFEPWLFEEAKGEAK